MQTQEPIVYQGQFGSFTIEDHDRQSVIIYRIGLAIAALSFAIATGLAFGQNLFWITPIYFLFWTALGVSLFTIHIYLKPLHLALQGFWMIGGIASIVLLFVSSEPLALYVYQHPIWIFGIGFTFAALTGIFFKEAFCFDRFETKLLTPIIPVLLLGHLSGWLPLPWEQALLGIWAVLFAVFAIRKLIQPIPPDIGDKSVFEYLKQKHS
ncbi:putative integral membrane protein [Leptolyngbya sp. NIES-3755]|nr:putative integral membrane protein [Leptolyngbya sp. NIES-3755]